MPHTPQIYQDLVREISALKSRIQELEQSESDLNKRMEASEENLKESSLRYNNLIDQSRSIILEWDTEGRILFLNRWGLKFFGYSKEEIIGRNVIGTIVAPTDNSGENLVDRMSKIQKTPDKYYSSENENIRKNGEPVWIGWTNRGIFDKDGKLVKTLSVGIDRTVQHRSEIALIQSRKELETKVQERTRELQEAVASRTRELEERKRAEKELKESEEKFRLSFMTGLDAYFWATLEEGRLIEVNPVFEDIFGYTRDAIIGKTSLELGLFADPADQAKMISELKAKGFVKDLEMKGRKKDNTIIAISFSASKMLINDQMFSLGVIRDITERKKSLSMLQEALTGTVQAMATVVESRDPYTAGHQLRVAKITEAIASEIGLAAHRIEGLRLASLIHDLGKIAVPAEFLSKPTRLTEAEFELIKGHSRAGREILKDISFPWPISRIVLEHHERLDGSGYPNGLAGEAILLESRILMVADVVEAMASHRPYRPALGIEAALKEIEKNRGTLYDGAVVDACLFLFREKGFRLEGS
jgi:PAS domain S-box-containing protein/putative nucleotidyltransferase with HDIG domain